MNILLTDCISKKKIMVSVDPRCFVQAIPQKGTIQTEKKKGQIIAISKDVSSINQAKEHDEEEAEWTEVTVRHTNSKFLKFHVIETPEEINQMWMMVSRMAITPFTKDTK